MGFRELARRALRSGMLAGYYSVALIALIALIALPHQAKAAAAFEAFGRLQSVDRVAMSPDGARLALVASNAQGQQLQIRTTADLKLVSASALGNTKVIELEWATPDHLIIVTAKTAQVMELTGPKREWMMAAVLDLKENKARPLLRQQDPDVGPRTVPRMNSVYGTPQVQVFKGRPVAIMTGESFIDNQGTLTIFREALDKTSSVETIATGNGDTQSLLVDETGRAVARADYNTESGEWSLWTRQSGGWQLAHKATYKIDEPTLIGFGRDTSTVMVLAEEETGERYREVSLAKAAWSEPIDALDDAELIADRQKGTIIGGYVAEGSGYRYVFFDPADQQLWDKIAKAFPGEVVRLASWSDDRNKIVLQVEGAKSGAAYYLLDRATRRAEWIADEYSTVGPEQIAEVRAISYHAKDGLEIPAYLTLPRGVPAKGLPLVLLVHGGPASRDYPGFDWWSQGIAAMGYAVLQPEFRGSAGYATSFFNAGQGEFGRKMQTDLSDGVSYLASQGIVDPGKVCIAGASYGGYAAMAGVTLQSGVYRCAIAVAGLSSLSRHLIYTAQETGSTRDATRRYWLRFLGARNPGDPIVDELSPMRHADRLSVPLLLIHGSIDTVVEPEQSKMMLQAGQKAGKSVQLVTLKGEDHNLSRSDTRLQMLQAMAEFLHANLPPATPAAVTASAKP